MISFLKIPISTAKEMWYKQILNNIHKGYDFRPFQHIAIPQYHLESCEYCHDSNFHSAIKSNYGLEKFKNTITLTLNKDGIFCE